MARSRGSGRRTDYAWEGTPGFLQGMAANASAVATVVTTLVSTTLYRMRGDLLVSIDGPVANDVTCVGLGIIAVTEE